MKNLLKWFPNNVVMSKKEYRKVRERFSKEYKCGSGCCPKCGLGYFYCGLIFHYVECVYGKEKAREFKNRYGFENESVQETLKTIRNRREQPEQSKNCSKSKKTF